MSTQSDQDFRWMQRALELARRGLGLCSPNPAVGCALVDRDGQLCGEGWHEYDRVDHAEAMAWKDAQQRGGDRMRGGTAYVTLEPCNHTGRTPPCASLLIAAGLSRVVAATTDPNPRVAGHGLEALRAAGIQTETGVCAGEAQRLNDGFARWSQSGRPFLLMKVAMSLDGRIAPPAQGRSPGEPYRITSEAARTAVQRLRGGADAVLAGIGTVIADDPLLTDRSGCQRRRPLLRVVLDTTLRMPLDAKLVQSAQNDVLIFTLAKKEERIRELKARGVRVEVLPAEKAAQRRVPLDGVLERLGAENILMLLTETGARLNGAFLAAGLVDRLQLFMAPRIMGSDSVAAFEGIPGLVEIANVEVERYGEDLGVSSLLRDPWPS